jgi:signal transduction histidine kinase
VLRAQGLVDNVFDFARSGGAPSPDAAAGVLEVVDQVVEEARSVDPAERPEIQVGPLPDCAVRCSRGVLSSILGNLVRNAIKFMRDSAERRISIRVVEVGDAVRFEVEDTGPGVPPGLEEAIFLPYVRGEGVTQPGLGLGLATVRRFCEAHGGTAGVRSTSGRGSVFFFTLPRAAEKAAGEAPASGPIVRGLAG